MLCRIGGLKSCLCSFSLLYISSLYLSISYFSFFDVGTGEGGGGSSVSCGGRWVCSSYLESVWKAMTGMEQSWKQQKISNKLDQHQHVIIFHTLILNSHSIQFIFIVHFINERHQWSNLDFLMSAKTFTASK